MHTLEELDVYNLSQSFSDSIWFMVEKWENFPKFGIGKQITNSADSISSNIAEGYGRYFIKENIKFLFLQQRVNIGNKKLAAKIGEKKSNK